jgi:uncharacterized protein YkwD
MQLRPRLTALAALSVVAFSSSAGQADASGCAAASAQPTSVSLSASRQATLCLLNKERAKHHLRSLRENHRLDVASARHSRAMVRNHYFDHGDFAGRIHNAGYSGRSLGENIAWGSLQYSTPASIVKMWMHSPGLRANILRAGFRDIGIGIARGAPQAGVHGAATYTTDFGTPR